MGQFETFPEPRANFVPVPEVFFDTLLKAGLSREELTVTLFLVCKTYSFDKDLTLVPLEAIVAGTDLDPVAAERGLTEALSRGTVLQFRMEASASPKNLYLLKTDENLRVIGPSSQPSARPQTPPAEVPSAASPAAGSGEVTRITPVPRPRQPEPPPAPVRSPEVDIRDFESLLDVSSSGVKNELSPRTFARIAKALGRELTKDERERLEELNAPESRLLDALKALEKRQVEIYSSDLIIYEYESLRASERRQHDDSRRRTEIDQAKQRQRVCKKCNGLGYLFVGVNTIEECVCRKTR